ncbi:MAG: TonB-dependent vitamin B12 receptor [Pseudomonadota bacterium]|nr:TonB-dependent vitamin B12 receptor [Pseudomonadota bacterium]
MQRTTLAAVIAGLFTLPVQAAEIPTLDEIVVTATRTARAADETLAATTVITRRDIERTQAQSVQELLAGQPGITIANNGGAGKATSVFLRGTQSGHVLVLIDGIKVGSATSGTAAFQDFPLDTIERIEIVRGPLSSLYGSEAIGGVIQIFTRKGGGDTTPSASFGLGSHGTRQAAAALTGGGKESWFNLRASHFQTDGFSVQSKQPDADGYRNTAFTLRGGHRFKPGSELDVHLMRADSKNEYDNAFGPVNEINEAESTQLVLGASLKHRVNDFWNTRLAAGQSRDESDAFKNGVYSSTFNTRRNTLSWQNDLDLGSRRQLTLGADYQEDKVESSTAYTVSSRDNTGVFAQLLAGAGAHDFKLSLRHDDNSQFGVSNTGNAAWGMNLGAGMHASLSYGTAFKAPTFNQLYYPSSAFYQSNPNLVPEKSRSFEAALSGRMTGGKWSLNAFETRIYDLIAGFTPVSNISTARIQGLEAVASLQLGAWDTRMNVTLQNPEQTSGANTGKLLDRRAEQSLRLDLDRAFGTWNLGGTFRAEGRRYDNLANTTKLSGYGLVDLRAETRLSKDWQLQAKLENLFDKAYETAATYNQPGRGIYLTLRYQPGK